MENTRRSFIKKMTAAGIGSAGLAISGNVAATSSAEPTQPQSKKKTPEKMTVSYGLVLLEQAPVARNISIMS